MASSGYPGKKQAGIGGTSLDRVQYEAEASALGAVEVHELHIDPHPQYLDPDDVGFVMFFKWGA